MFVMIATTMLRQQIQQIEQDSLGYQGIDQGLYQQSCDTSIDKCTCKARLDALLHMHQALPANQSKAVR